MDFPRKLSDGKGDVHFICMCADCNAAAHAFLIKKPHFISFAFFNSKAQLSKAIF